MLKTQDNIRGNMKSKVLLTVFLLAGFCLSQRAMAQKDTTKHGIDIFSVFKPVLKDAAKINFSASPAPVDSTRQKLNYDVPNQNLNFSFQPASLKPLAMDIDSGGKFDNSNYIKAGFGSLRTPFLQAGFSLGDGKTAGLNIYAKHSGSDGKLNYQKYTNTDVDLKGYFKSAKTQWDAGIGMNQLRTYKYGYLPDSLVFPNDSLKQNFQTFSGRLAMQNINQTKFGLTYHPEIKIDIFNDNLKNAESNTVVNLPLQKTVGRVFAVNLGVTFDLTRYTLHNKTAIDNTMYYLSPSVLLKTPNVNLEAGIRPSWDNKTFKMFPNILASINTNDTRFVFQAGWTGYVRKTTYQYLAGINPWLWAPASQLNTWIEERFAGFKGAVGNNFTYSAKVGFDRLTNQPLFVNDYSAGGKSFKVVYEPKMNVLNFGGEVGYTIGEKFSALAHLDFNQYTDLVVNAKAFGLIPLELDAAMRLEILKDLWLKSDLFAWSGPQYLNKDGETGTLSSALDLNAGLEFRIRKNLNIYSQFNNIFNKQYQRWNQYPSYGFNFTAGVVFSFAQKN